MNSTNLHLNKQDLSTEHLLIMQQSPLLEGLSTILQQELLTNGKALHFKKNTMLFMDGNKVDTIYYVISGKVKEYFCNSYGDDCLRQIIGPGQYISLHKMFATGTCYTYTCEALSKTTCYSWKFDFFKTILEREPSLALQTAKLFSQCMENGCRLNCICRKTQATSRVAAYLLSKHNRHCLGAKFCCRRQNLRCQVDVRPLGLSAHDICLARETFSRSLASLQEKQLITLNSGVIELLDLDGLKKISGAG